MADLMMVVGTMGPLENTTDVYINGYARTSDMTLEDLTVDWQAQVGVGDLASTINAAIKDAAIAAVLVAGFTVGALDKKTVFGGAAGL